MLKDIINNVTQDELSVLMEAGYLYLGTGEYEKAKEIFEGVCALVPECAVPVIALGTLYMSQGDIEKGVEYCRQGVELQPDSSYTHMSLGKALLLNNQKDAACLELNKAMELDKDGCVRDAVKALLDAVEQGVL
jgi:tetratricopeptide (TPR) repeat protein